MGVYLPERLHLDSQSIAVVDKRGFGRVVGRPEDIRAYAPDGSDVDHDATGADQHFVEVMYHTHRPEHIYSEHFFHLPDVRVGRCHCIAYRGDMSLVR